MNHSNHAFKELDLALEQLERLLVATIDKILEMNALCQQSLAAIAEKETVRGYLRQARALDKEINAIEAENITLIQNIISKYTPRGRDLRLVIGSVKLATLLESGADKLENCIKRLYKMETPPGAEVTAQLRQMLTENATLMQLVPKLLEEFDEEISAAMVQHRRRIEALYREVWLQKANTKSTEQGEAAGAVGFGAAAPTEIYHNTVMLAKNIERIADTASDIKKIIYFIQTGERLVKKKKAA